MTKSAEELEQIYVEGDFDLMGTAVSRRGYEHWSPEWQLTRLQGKIDEERLEALDAGAKPTASELDVAWRELLAGDLEDEFATGNPVSIETALKTYPSVVVILARGGPGLELGYFGAFGNDEDAKAALLKEFYLDLWETPAPGRLQY